MSKYEEIFKSSLKDPSTFWGNAAEDVKWIKKFDKVVHTDGPPFYKWFKGGKINTCYNALDRHVDEGNGDRTALIYDSAMINVKKKFSYKELRDKTAELAGALQRYGIKKGVIKHQHSLNMIALRHIRIVKKLLTISDKA